MGGVSGRAVRSPLRRLNLRRSYLNKATYSTVWIGQEIRALHSLTSELNLRTFGNTSLTLELNLSTFGTHPWVNWDGMGD